VIAFSRDPRSLKEDCRNADVLVTGVVMPWALRQGECRGRIVIDPPARVTLGTHALTVGPDGVRVRTVEAARGARPWSRPR
jgi:hypothetical protein